MWCRETEKADRIGTRGAVYTASQSLCPVHLHHAAPDRVRAHHTLPASTPPTDSRYWRATSRPFMTSSLRVL